MSAQRLNRAPEWARRIEEADHLADDERYEEAVAILDRLLADKKLVKKWRIQALMSRASIFDDLGDTKRALADCAAARALGPKSPDILYLRAVIHQSAENWSASRADLDAAIKLASPGSTRTRSVANATRRRSQVPALPGRAASRMRRGGGSIAPSSELYEVRGLARYNLGDYKGARADFARAIAGNPDIEVRFHVYRGMAALLLDEPKAAIDDFTNALASDDTDAKALAQRAKAYEACGDLKNALADLDRLHEMLPPSPMLEAERKRVSELASRRTGSARSRARR